MKRTLGAGRSCICLGLISMLSACGNGAKDLPIVMMGQLLADKAEGLAAEPAAIIPPEEVARRALAATDRPVLMVKFEDDPQARVLFEIQSNGNYVVWGAPDRRTLTTYRGVLAETRGLKQDMMASDVAALATTLTSGASGPVSHKQTYLTPEYVTQTVTASCTVTAGPGGALSESCRDGETSFENSYSLGSRGEIRSARQWVSPLVGYITITRLR
ncbi:YjbF family lipoprotein [Pseudooceanicola sp. C21-150M6]|uniref:YjbF family lipoprotein n=1 Tax=Pseudooceanicola sp. C21-150M6 TaxID=3434355 RepID=UPI003D7FB3F1